MKKILLAALFATVAGALVFGAAASLGVNSNDLGSGGDDVVSCDLNGVDVTYGVDDEDNSRIDTVTVADIDETNCAGETVYVTLSDDSNVVLAGGTGSSAPVAGTSVDVTVDVAAADVHGVDVTITG
ncbi:MAG TPA: hypothetical protein VGA13_04070 [Acidimicrobiales bacterium]